VFEVYLETLEELKMVLTSRTFL